MGLLDGGASLKLSRLLVCCFILGLTFTSLSWAAQQQSFLGTGTAVVLNDDQITAKQLAQNSALRNAVGKAIESIIKKGTKEEKQYHLHKPELLKGPYPFLIRDDIHVQKQDGKLLIVSVKIFVNTDSLTQLLGQKGILAERIEQQKRRELPPIMVLVGEEISGRPHIPSFSSTFITKTLLEKEFNLVDQEGMKGSVKHDQAVQRLLRGKKKAAYAMALQYKAGILVSGKAVAQKSSSRLGGMQVYGATVTLKAYHPDSGQLFASATASGTYPHINALTGAQKAIEEATAKSLNDLLKDFQQEFETSESTLLVSISDISFRQLAKLKEVLQVGFPSLTDIQPKSFQANVSKLQFTITNSPEEFVDQMSTYDFGKFTLEVLSYSPRKIDFSLRLKSLPRG